jgi:DNA-binding CsgD family transcriptional regulator
MDGPPVAVDLTQRELEVLRLVASGRTNRELGRQLWVTTQTVKFHLSNIYRKLGVANRAEAAQWAQAHGLIEEAPDPR